MAYQPIQVYDPAGRIGLELDRTAYLVSLARDKTVLHVGCADHPVTQYRLEAGMLLHSALAGVARALVGVDLEAAAVSFLERQGLRPVRLMDAENLELGDTFDLVLAGDVLEHMNNPGRFLERVPALLNRGGSLALGVPNALSFDVFRYAIAGVERTHPDHTAYHTPKTLTQLCSRYGLVPVRLAFTAQPKDKFDSRIFIWVRNALLRTTPRLAPAFVMLFRRKEDVDATRFFVWR